jgi:outer membrane protein TolC
MHTHRRLALPRHRPVPTVLCALLVISSGEVAAQATTLHQYVEIGLAANLGLKQQELSARQASFELAEARSALRPSLQMDARYSRADGGRSFDIPIGDLMNPVHRTLNEILEAQGRPGPFPTIDNQTIDFLRSREQETRLRVSQVLWNPAVRSNVRARQAIADAGVAGTAAARGQLVRDIKISYYRLANATQAVAILDAAVELVQENERSSTALWQASLVTRDQVDRARAERLEIEQDRERAETDRILAASYLNFLLNRPSNAPVELDARDLDLPDSRRLTWLRQAATSRAGDATAWVDSLATAAVAGRAELRQLDHAAAAADAGLAAARGSRLPSVAVAVDAGIQGEAYGLGSEDRFVMASLVMSWSVTNGGGERARIRSASLETERARARRDEAARRIQLEVEAAARNATLALNGLESARERVQAAEGAFRLVSRRQGEGLATPLEFLDARAAFTRAQLSRTITETEVLIRLAELEYASGDWAPPSIRAVDEEYDR